MNLMNIFCETKMVRLHDFRLSTWIANWKFHWSRLRSLWSIERQATYKHHLQYDVFFTSNYSIHIHTFRDSWAEPFSWLVAYDSEFASRSHSLDSRYLMITLASEIISNVKYAQNIRLWQIKYWFYSQIWTHFFGAFKKNYYLSNVDGRFVDVCDLSLDVREKITVIDQRHWICFHIVEVVCITLGASI